MYSKISVHGDCDINYLHVQKNKNSDKEISEVVGRGIHLPSWGSNTVMLSDYQNTIDATPLSLTDGVVVGYQVQRYDRLRDVMRFVTQTSHAMIQDYNIEGGIPYQYYIFPVIEIDEIRTLGSPIVTDEVTPMWDMCTIIGLKETDKNNEYTVDTGNIWRIHLNVEPNEYVLNTDKQFTDGFSRFPKRTQGVKRYVTSGVKSILGTIDCTDTKITNTIHDIERWETFCHSSNLKLFSDMHGRVLPIDIQSVSTGYLTSISENSPIVTSITYVQMADANEISVYGLDGV